MQIQIDTEAAKQVEELFRVAPDITVEEMLVAVTEADLLLVRETQEGTPVGVGGGGGLKGSITSREEVASNAIIGVTFSNLPHAAPVELGAKPHFPPVDPIKDWVEQKLGISEEESEGVAMAIAWKIKHHGTEGAFMFRNAFETSENQVVAILDAAAARIVERVGGS